MRVHATQALRLLDSVVTIGAFDGVHRGHQALIRQAVTRAARFGVPSVAYTFDPPPKVVFGGAPLLTPRPEKISRLAALGLDHAVIADFDAAYASRSAENFLEELGDLNPVEVWVGSDFRFGYKQAGDVEMLGRRFATRVFEPVQCPQGEVISSSRVRALLALGAVDEARSLLGGDAAELASASRAWYPAYEDQAPLLSYAGAAWRSPEVHPREHSYIW